MVLLMFTRRLRCSLRTGTLLLLLAGGVHPSAHSQPRYRLEGDEQPVALLSSAKGVCVVTQGSVFRMEGKRFVRKYQSTAPIRCALGGDTAIWLGTERGLFRIDGSDFKARKLSLPVSQVDPNVTALFRDATGAAWVGVEAHGTFRLVNGRFEKALGTTPVNAGVATADSSVWIGTNVGLNRWQHQQWVRYNEEGVANREIPDNIVEKLILDNYGNLWVITSAGISVFEGNAPGSTHGAHLPTVRFIGKPNNEVRSVAHVNGEGYLFATAMGLLLLPDGVGDHFEGLEHSADKVENKQLLRHISLGNAPGQVPFQNPDLIVVDRKKRIWLVSRGEVIALTRKAFHRLVEGDRPGRG